MDCSPPGSSVHGIFQARILEWISSPLPEDLPDPGLTQVSLHAGGFFTAWAISSVQSLSRVWLLATPWTAAHQASLFITNPWSVLKLMFIESVMASNHLILCCPLLFPPSIFPSIRVFSNELGLRIRWPGYWSFSFNISPPVNIQDWFPLGWTCWISLKSKGLSRAFSEWRKRIPF